MREKTNHEQWTVGSTGGQWRTIERQWSEKKHREKWDEKKNNNNKLVEKFKSMKPLDDKKILFKLSNRNLSFFVHIFFCFRFISFLVSFHSIPFIDTNPSVCLFDRTLDCVININFFFRFSSSLFCFVRLLFLIFAHFLVVFVFNFELVFQSHLARTTTNWNAFLKIENEKCLSTRRTCVKCTFNFSPSSSVMTSLSRGFAIEMTGRLINSCPFRGNEWFVNNFHGEINWHFSLKRWIDFIVTLLLSPTIDSFDHVTNLWNQNQDKSNKRARARLCHARFDLIRCRKKSNQSVELYDLWSTEAHEGDAFSASSGHFFFKVFFNCFYRVNYGRCENDFAPLIFFFISQRKNELFLCIFLFACHCDSIAIKCNAIHLKT